MDAAENNAEGSSSSYEIQVPEGVDGQSYVVLTACKDRVSDETVIAGPAIVEITNAYPMVASS